MGSDGAARPGRATKRGRCPREGWGALGALCSSQGESTGQEGEGDVVSLEMSEGSCPSLCHRPLTDVLRLGMGTLFI